MESIFHKMHVRLPIVLDSLKRMQVARLTAVPPCAWTDIGIMCVRSGLLCVHRLQAARVGSKVLCSKNEQAQPINHDTLLLH